MRQMRLPGRLRNYRPPTPGSIETGIKEGLNMRSRTVRRLFTFLILVVAFLTSSIPAFSSLHLIKYDRDGELQWVESSNSGTSGASLQFGRSGHIYVIDNRQILKFDSDGQRLFDRRPSQMLLAVVDAEENVLMDCGEQSICKWDSGGHQLWKTRLDGFNVFELFPLGNHGVVVGTYYQEHGGEQYALFGIDGAGNRLWHVELRDLGFPGQAIYLTDSAGNTYAAGDTEIGEQIVKLSAEGTVEWIVDLGELYPALMAINNQGEVFVASYQAGPSSDAGFYVRKLNAQGEVLFDGRHIWSTFPWGGSILYDIAADNSGGVLILGEASEPDVPADRHSISIARLL